MAYESSIPFADIRDFREAEINGIPALFTMSRLDSETLPADFHSCEVMGGRGSDFQWLVPLALANFTGTFVSRQPLLREGQAYAEIRRYGIMTRRQSTNGLKTTTITLKHYATKIQTEGQLYLQRLFYPACGFRQGGRTSCFRTMRNGSECYSNDSRRRIRGRLAFRQTSPACNPGSNRSSGDP